MNSCKICAKMGIFLFYFIHAKVFFCSPTVIQEVSFLENLLLQVSVYNIFAHFFLNLCINLKALNDCF